MTDRPQYWYPTAFDTWGESERVALRRVVDSGQYTMGREVAALEEEFAELYYRRHCVAVNSGSSANLVAVAALVLSGRVARGTHAVVPALAWPTTYAPLVQYDLQLHLADCDDSWCASPSRSLRPLPATTGLVVSVPVLGCAAHAQAWCARARELSVPVIEDCCESVWAADNAGNIVGRRGDLSTFSFYYSHHISAIEGGAILTDDPELARLCRVLRNHGWTRGVDVPKTFGDEYRFEHMGYNVRPVEMHAAVARVQIDPSRVLGGRSWRLRNHDYFAGRAPPGIRVRDTGYMGRGNPFAIAFEVNSSATRARLAAELRAAGIDCRPAVGGSLGRQPYGAPWRGQPTPRADEVHDCGMMLGCAPFDIHDKIDRALVVIERVTAPGPVCA